ncbi:ImuA family protein [Notoacmeibacter sp. MSK16QG-6]|uniref:ImuA family protein n=1 Tax=Notoacmeibacter sp. MSK16QG-6 TaxID=2957982 RepID=UPI00209F3580|nr:hypothetical protein [Notoacmeibacter sp. MSK16QG-6]MCP1200298.1 hypothetical protein [Notoacmeibacter sp. MSK16QG-6]
MTGFRPRISAREPFAPVPLPDGRARLAEAFSAQPCDGASTGFVLAHLRSASQPFLWITDRLTLIETGEPYTLSTPFIRARLAKPADVLIAAEEGLRCGALSAVVAELWGNPKPLDFTASKRLAMRAETAGIPCWLIRHDATPDLSAARERWRLQSLPSLPLPDDAKAPGGPLWHAELFRSRERRPGHWVASYDHAAHRLDLVPALSDGALDKTAATTAQRVAS